MKPNWPFAFFHWCILVFLEIKNPPTGGRNIIQRNKRYSDAAANVIHTQATSVGDITRLRSGA